MWDIFQYQLCQGSKCNLFTMIHMMAFFQYCQTIVDCMSSCKSGTFKSNSGKQSICLNDLFHCRSTYTSLQSDFSFHAFFHQSIKAKLCQCHCSTCCVSACAGSCFTSLACSCLKISCKRITHTCYSKSACNFSLNRDSGFFRTFFFAFQLIFQLP